MAGERNTGRIVAIVGAAALAAWLLSRGKDWGFRGPGAGTDASGASRAGSRAVVWIRADRLEVDGTAADLPTVVDRSRAVGAVEVRATGDAITGDVWNVLKTLHAAGVTIYTTPDLSSVVPSEVVS